MAARVGRRPDRRYPLLIVKLVVDPIPVLTLRHNNGVSMSIPPVMRCPLCDFDNAYFFWHGGKASRDRDFYRCDTCDLVFVPERFFISREDEKKTYLQHNNEIYDPGYRKFLSNLYNESVGKLRLVRALYH